MKKVVLIPDSFKGTMKSEQICSIMKESINRFYPSAEVVSIPVADGGEGSVDCFLSALGGEKIYMRSVNPMKEPIECYYGLIDGGETAIIEMAACAGLPLIENRKNPLEASTYGVGLQILDAARQGARRVIVGLGGSATNDGGCGAASAVGIRFFDKNGDEFVPAGGTLSEINRVDLSGLEPSLFDVEIIAMCDIDNPLHGSQGAAAVFGPQKGATPEMVSRLDLGLRHLAEIVHRDTGREVAHIPGAGAAGGMGAGMIAFFGAELRMGIETVLDTVKFNSLLQNADMVFTGEGRIDGQSMRGKVVIGVARRAKKLDVPVVAVVGDVVDPVEQAHEEGVTAIFSINRTAKDFSSIRHLSPVYLKDTMDNLMRLLSRLRY